MESVNDMRIKNGLMLLLTAFIWGTAFVAQSVGMDYLEPFTFNGVRSLIGGAALLPCIWILQKLNGRSKDTGTKKDLLTGGLACGVLLFAASSLQQIGIKYTTAGKAGFITAFYIVIVPVMGVFLHKKIGWKIWLAVVLAVAGLYFLCITESFSVGKGDILVFLCALVFAVHILVIDHFAPKVDGVKMSCMRNFVRAIYVCIGDTKDNSCNDCMDANFICRGIILWSCLYTTDTRTEKCKSGGGITAFKSGIVFFCTGRLDCAGRKTVNKGNVGMYIDVCCNYPGTGS